MHRGRLLARLSVTVSPMEPLSELIEHRARDDAAKPFCVFDDARLSFGDLRRRVRRLASGFAALGVRPGDHVAVMLGNHSDHPVVFLALAALGATQIPVNVHLRGLGLEYVIAHSEARALVADERFAPELAPLLPKSSVDLLVWRGTKAPGGPLRSTSLADVEAAGVDSRPGAPDPDRVVSITYTSGTTGPPKGVMLGELPYLMAGHVAGQLADVRAGDVLLTWEPLYHIGGSQVIVACLQHGVPMALLERFTASAFWDAARRHHATQVHYLGGVLGLLLKQPARADDHDHSVRVAWGGGAPAHLWEPFERRFGVRIREAYGMTEAASFTTINQPGVTDGPDHRSSMLERRDLLGRAVGQRRGQRLERGGLLAQCVEEQVGHVAGHAGPDHHPQHREVLSVLGERVRGHEPALLAQASRDVEHGVVLDLRPQREREHG